MSPAGSRRACRARPPTRHWSRAPSRNRRRSPHGALAASANAGVLVAAGLEDDIGDCAQEWVSRVVPRVRAVLDGVAHVEADSEDLPLDTILCSHTVAP